MTQKPVFLVLTANDCSAILRRNHVGRLAFIRKGVVDIEPIGYAFDGDWIFLRSAHGTKLEALAGNPYVAFEVDEVAGPLKWKSVVVHGTVYVLDDNGAPAERQSYARALKSIRALVPAALKKDDPTPARTIVYGLHVDRVTGRMATSRAASAGGRKRQPVRRPPPERGTRDAS
jgi:nitroimidazol reductase NimA-like FMN-containing flavoprotein (pyridoxamine 5'-phosphate oxidase superfamily)